MKWLKHVKPPSKSCFNLHELQNLSQDTNMKRINLQQLPNLTQDTSMKRLNNVKLSSQSGFRTHELSSLSQDTITSMFVLNPFTRWVLSRCAALEWSQYCILDRMLAMPYHIHYLPGPFGQFMGPQNLLKNVKLLSKLGFGPQELTN